MLEEITYTYTLSPKGEILIETTSKGAVRKYIIENLPTQLASLNKRNDSFKEGVIKQQAQIDADIAKVENLIEQAGNLSK